MIHDTGYCPAGYADTDLRKGQWRQEIDNCQGLTEIVRIGSNNYTGEAKTVRENFCKYFNSNYGSVSWQFEYIHRTLDTFDKTIYGLCSKQWEK